MQQPFSAKLALSSAMFYLEQYGKRDPFQNALLVPPELLLKAGNNVYILCFAGKYEQVLPMLYQRSEFSAYAPSQVAATFAQCWACADEPYFPWLPTFQLNSLHAQQVSFHLESMRLAVRAGCFPLPLHALFRTQLCGQCSLQGAFPLHSKTRGFQPRAPLTVLTVLWTLGSSLRMWSLKLLRAEGTFQEKQYDLSVQHFSKDGPLSHFCFSFCHLKEFSSAAHCCYEALEIFVFQTAHFGEWQVIG